MDKAPIKKVKVLRNFWMGDDIQEKGKVISVSARVAGELVSMNKAQEVSETSAPAPARDTFKKGG